MAKRKAKMKAEPTKRAIPEQWAYRLREGAFIGLAAICTYVFIALSTYHASDPGWSTTGSGEAVRNAGGITGAYIADIFYTLFGFMAFLFPIMLGYRAWLILRDRHQLQGFEDVSVLDISASALRISKARLNNPLHGVHWIECDLLHFEPERQYDLWHDRALFHFMTGERQRAAYRRILDQAVAPGGHVIIATFAIDGPEQCSGLPVRRYDADAVREEFGDGYRLESEQPESHLTPGGTEQKFTYFRLRRV